MTRLNAETLATLRRQLHAHPETGFCERWTSAFLAKFLKDAGAEVHENIAQTGLVAVVPGRDRSRALGYRADIDALPITEKLDVPWKSTNGCMHACGHDFHMTIALGTALSLLSSPEKPACDVAFVFQPNEEGAPGEMPSGAELMCREGILERFHIQRMMALHCDPTLKTGKIGICHGSLWAASGRFVVTITGKSAHAAYPERGNDALWAASEMISAIYAALRRRRPPIQEVVSICKLNAGTAFNVIAGEARFEGIMRAPSRNILKELGMILKETAESVSAYTHVTVQFEQFYGADAVINDAEMARIAAETLAPSGTGINISMTMASEDFSHFSEQIPCFYAMLGVCPESQDEMPPLHADTFNPDENALLPAVRSMQTLLSVFAEMPSN